MAATLVVGTEAPNFDLTSTEDVVLMLRDEVPRMAVLLYFFDGDDDRVQSDLKSLTAAQGKLKERGAVILGVSAAKVDALKELQRQLQVQFPLLADDREFSSKYGVVTASEDEPGAPAFAALGKAVAAVRKSYGWPIPRPRSKVASGTSTRRSRPCPTRWSTIPRRSSIVS